MDSRVLAEALFRRAEEERQQILAAAREEAAAIRARAERDIAGWQAAATAGGRERGRREAARLISQARIEVLGERLRLLDRAIREAFAGATEWLGGVRARPDYPELLRGLLVEALRQMPPGEEVRVIVDPLDAPLIERTGLPETATVAATGHCLGGVVIESRSGALTVENTLEARVAAGQRSLRPAIARLVQT